MNERSAEEQVREVYARFGLALYFAQVLERGIVNALIFLDLIPNRSKRLRSTKEWETEYDAFASRHFQKTLGGLIRALGEVKAVPDELEKLLASALHERNRLAHYYFWERADEFMTTPGCNRMITELAAARDLFDHADKRLMQITAAIRTRHGFTEERIEMMVLERLTTVSRNG